MEEAFAVQFARAGSPTLLRLPSSVFSIKNVKVWIARVASLLPSRFRLRNSRPSSPSTSLTAPLPEPTPSLPAPLYSTSISPQHPTY